MPTVKSQRCCARELSNLVHPHDGPKLLAMLRAYLDESGIHDGAAVCVVAGYFAGRGQWEKFEPGWTKTLERYGVPLKDFHAKNMVKMPGYQPLLQALANVIANHAQKIHPVGVAVRVADFNKFTLGERRFLTGATVLSGARRRSKFETSGCPSKPYFVPFSRCLHLVAGYAPRGGKVHFFMGTDRTFSRYALSLFEHIKGQVAHGKAAYRDRLGMIAFPDAKETPELQAADLLVHLTYLHTSERIETGDWKRPPSRLLNTCLQGLRSREDHLLLDAESMQASLDMIPPEAWGDLRSIAQGK